MLWYCTLQYHTSGQLTCQNVKFTAVIFRRTFFYRGSLPDTLRVPVYQHGIRYHSRLTVMRVFAWSADATTGGMSVFAATKRKKGHLPRVLMPPGGMANVRTTSEERAPAAVLMPPGRISDLPPQQADERGLGTWI
jgi:hypothetical protein